MTDEVVSLKTQDGLCSTRVLTPAEGKSWPAVVFYMDAGGIRPALVGMAKRLAEAGYLVLLPDLFYRHGPYGPLSPKAVFAGDWRAILGPLLATTGPSKAAQDTSALLSYLETRGDVTSPKIGAVGFCMGGGMALTAAAAHPERFAAAASFHGGNLATDAPDSPHRMALRLKAEVYIGAAQNDGSYPPEMAQKLENALTEAGVRYSSRTYPAAHGWMIPDFETPAGLIYDPAAAEQGWTDMLALFDRILRRAG